MTIYSGHGINSATGQQEGVPEKAQTLCWRCGRRVATTTRPNALGTEKPACDECARMLDKMRAL